MSFQDYSRSRFVHFREHADGVFDLEVAMQDEIPFAETLLDLECDHLTRFVTPFEDRLNWLDYQNIMQPTWMCAATEWYKQA